MRLTQHSKPMPFPFLPSAIIVLVVMSVSVLLLWQCVATHGRHVLSGSWDKTLILWNVDSGKEVHQFRGHTEGTSHTLRPSCWTFLSCFFNSVCKGDTDSEGTYHTIRPCCWTLLLLLSSFLRGPRVDDYSGTSPSFFFLWLCVWGLGGSQMMRLPAMQKRWKWTTLSTVAAITAVQFDEVKAVSGSADGDVRVWSLDTGQCSVELTGQPDNEVVCTHTHTHTHMHCFCHQQISLTWLFSRIDTILPVFTYLAPC